MRLLQKKEIDKLKATEQAQKVSEGLKISTKVDALRELKVKEEESLAKWRNESVSAIQGEIDVLVSQKEGILSDVLSLREEVKRGTSEVAKRNQELNGEWEKLLEIQTIFDRDSAELDRERAELHDSLTNVSDELERTRTQTEVAEQLHKEAWEDRNNAKLELVVAETTKNQMLKSQEESDREISVREEIIARQDEYVTKQKADYEVKFEEMRIKELQLIDREQTLEREIKRQQKNV